MLHIYVAEHCPGSPTARRLAAWLREQAPEIPIGVVDIGAPAVVIPPAVSGTPTYTWDDRIIPGGIGNPALFRSAPQRSSSTQGFGELSSCRGVELSQCAANSTWYYLPGQPQRPGAPGARKEPV